MIKSFKSYMTLFFWTISYFKNVKLFTVIYILCGSGIVLGEILIPRRMGWVIDNIVPTGKIPLLLKELFMLIFIIAMIFTFKYIYNILEQRITNKITKVQQLDLLTHLQNLGAYYYEKVPAGEILAMFENAVNQTQQTYTFLFPQFVYNFAQFFVPSVLLIIQQPLFFIAAMIGNIIYAFLNHFANNKIAAYLKAESEASQKSQQTLYNAIEATTELNASDSAKWYQNITNEDFDRFRKARMGSIFWRHFRYTTVGLSLTISVILFYFFGIKLVMNNKLSVGSLIGYSFLMGLISRGFSVFFYIIPAQQNALNYAKYLYDFLHIEPPLDTSTSNLKLKSNGFNISFNNVYFGYNDHLLLKNLTLDIPEGTKVAIVGESGNGKSTLLKLVDRFYDVNDGAIMINNVNIKNIELQNLRSICGYVFQEAHLFQISIMDNIRLGNLNATDDEVINAAKKAMAHEFIMSTELGYNTIIKDRGTGLSGGQRQRISIARMILKDPDIMLLDEATSALDNKTEAEITELFNRISINKTVITVAHRLSTIIDYDMILVLSEGKIAESGTYDSLLESKGLFYTMMTQGAQI